MNIEDIKNAYRKYKSYVYFNKNLTFQRENILIFEVDNKTVEEKFRVLLKKINSENEEVWNEYKKEILKSINVYMMPKNISSDKCNENSIGLKSREVCIKDSKSLQAFFDASVEVHILGILWIIFIGRNIDLKFYEHSYGNRLIQDKYIYTSKSPYLFKPYYNEYGKWRDRALKKAEELYDDKKDCIFITLDIKRFYYSIDFKEEMFDEFIEDKSDCVMTRINKFIFNVIEEYNTILPEKMKEKSKNTLPIGFMPSNILANWYLNEFDKVINNKINPVYYGRYVDDIIVVDRIEKNSEIYRDLEENCIKGDFVEKYFKEIIKKDSSQFIIDKKYGRSKKLEINSDKINIIPICSNETKIVIDKLRDNIRENSSEFRLLPEDKDILGEGYAKIYSIIGNDKVTKLRDIKSVDIDKYELSKFIGKQLSVGTIIEDFKENKFYEDISKIFTNQVIVDNYITWENVFTLCIVNNRLDKIYEFVKLMTDAIKSIEINEENIDLNYIDERCNDITESLKKHLIQAISRASSLMWGKYSKTFEENVAKIINSNLHKKLELLIHEYRNKLILTRMVNKLYTPILVDFFIQDRNNSLEECSEKKILLNDMWSFLKAYKNIYEDQEFIDILENDGELFNYSFYPYKINYEDLYRQVIIGKIYNGIPIGNTGIKDEINKLNEVYERLNIDSKNIKDNIVVKEIIDKGEIKKNLIKIGNARNKKLKIAVGNAHLKIKDFHDIFKGTPNRSLERYNVVVNLINQAIKEKVDILILPENYLPFEWIESIQRKCKNEQIGLITGVEHVVYDSGDKAKKKVVHNLIATILPYKVKRKGDKSDYDNEKEYKYIYTNIRNKIHYSPDEEIAIKDYGYQPVEGDIINLFIWNDIWFPIYCCFELASINIRSSFLALLDLIVVVEWNKDVEYFSNIIDSLSRDMHGYCVQVNSAHYGDSCIIRPTHSHSTNILRTSGGSNNVILVGEIDISKLRDFQIKGYVHQKEDDSFKRTPPGFNKEYVKDKINNVLFEKLGYEE